ncbi:MAG: hypothetical protein H6Q88_1214, partial [Anaeromyxobacteraceae bacterium]|nr:hypothetical protein [Anaeromyxobacteraceae bacterium]
MYPAAQAIPHAPQFSGSVWVFVHTSEGVPTWQVVFGGRHWQVPAEQTLAATQTMLQPPQLDPLESVFTQVSVVGSPFGQRTMGGDGASQVHAAPEQVPSPQEWPQAPQFAASVCTFTHWVPHFAGLSVGQAQSPSEQVAPLK